MKLEIVEEKENPVFKRKNIIISIDYGGSSTISKAELQKKIAMEMKAEPNHVEIKKILSNVGKSEGKAWIRIWQEKEVPIYKTKAEQKAEKEAPAEKPVEESKEEPKEEKPPEEKKEESKAEEKKEE